MLLKLSPVEPRSCRHDAAGKEQIMPRWPWIERTFNFDYPAEKWPDLLARVRGTPDGE
jgi:hypothetical protein